MSVVSSTALTHAKNLLKFIDKSPSPFHTVATVKDILVNSGFKEINDHDEWHLKPNDLVFVTKNYSTIIALAIGGKFTPGNGFSIVGAHTDSPCLRVKPVSEQSCKNYTKLGVETYGGGLWYTWFDRDLTVAGRCIVKTGGRYQHRLVNLGRPVARVPSLAIHLDRSANDSFSPSKELHLVPVLCASLKEQFNSEEKRTASQGIASHHPESLMTAIAKELEVAVEDIIDLELCLADTQPSAIGGINNDFVFAPRLDNLFNCHASVQALVDSLDSVANDSCIRTVCLFDNEEVGSQSAQGAESAFTELVLRRVEASLCAGAGQSPACHYERSIANSFLVSADQAHAVHPNFEDKHEGRHKPLLHHGIVLKTNSCQRYATNALTAGLLREVAEQSGVPLQDFVVRQDMACGTTIGPIMSAGMGLATVDVGGPQLSMHSCREMADVTSSDQAVRLFKGFFELYAGLAGKFRAEGQ